MEKAWSRFKPVLERGWRRDDEGELSGLGLVLPSDGALGKIACCGLNRLHAPSLIYHALHHYLIHNAPTNSLFEV